MRGRQVNWIGLGTLLAKEVRRFLAMPGQTIFPPLLTSLLYILIFGQLLGSRIQDILPGVSYIDFIVPGILMMNVVSGAFMNASFAIYLGKLQNSIQEVLVAPLSYAEMALGYVLAGALRGVLIGLGVYLIGVALTTATVLHFGSFLYFLVVTSLLCSALGAAVGLWAKSFEHINIPSTFIILPLSFLGGVFHSVRLLPPTFARLSFLNPIFYMVNGIRSSMIGASDVSVAGAAAAVGVLAAASFLWCVRLFRIGYRLRS
jgi:ABC-2 type transport system permease protein